MMIRATDLQGKLVRTQAGERLGRVSEIHLQDGRVTTLVCSGRGGFLQRFMAARSGRRIAWDKVRRLTDREIVVESPPSA
jgi:sporulation protein YlmC with PRC-barrel domain